MPQFSPGVEKTAIVPMRNPTEKPFDYKAELYMGTNLALMAQTPFHLEAAESKDISLPVTMPTEQGTYPVYIGVFSNGQFIEPLYQATEDVVIVGVPGNLLLNPGFESGFEGWTRYCNEPGRFNWSPGWEIGVHTGAGAAIASGNVSGRYVVAQMTQAVPWKDEYKGKTFKFSLWRMMVSGQGHAGNFAVIIDDGITLSQNEVYIGVSGWTEQAVTKTLGPYASKLQVTFQIIPSGAWRSAGLSVDDADLREI